MTGIHLLLGAAEQEFFQQLGCGEFLAFFERNYIGDIAYYVNDAPIVGQLNTFLAVMAKNDGIAHHNFAGIGFNGLGEQLQKRRLSGSIGAHDAHALLAFEFIGKIFNQFFRSVRLADVVQLDDFAAHPVFFDLDAHFVFFDFQGIVGFLPFKIGIHAGFGLGGTGLRAFAHPIKFVFEQFIGAFVGGGLHFFAQGFFLQIIGVVARVAAQLSAFQFDDAITHIFKEIAIVRDHKQGNARLLEVFFQPFDHFHVQVVGRLIENQEIGFFEQYFYQGDALFLSTRQRIDLLFEVGHAETKQRFFHFRIKRPGFQVVHKCHSIFEGRTFVAGMGEGVFVLLHGLHHRVFIIEYRAEHIQTGVKVRFLVEPADADVFAEDNLGVFAFGAFFAGNYAHEGTFTSTVFGNQTDFLPFIDVKREVLEQHFFTVALRDIFEC